MKEGNLTIRHLLNKNGAPLSQKKSSLFILLLFLLSILGFRCAKPLPQSSINTPTSIQENDAPEFFQLWESLPTEKREEIESYHQHLIKVFRKAQSRSIAESLLWVEIPKADSLGVLSLLLKKFVSAPVFKKKPAQSAEYDFWFKNWLAQVANHPNPRFRYQAAFTFKKLRTSKMPWMLFQLGSASSEAGDTLFLKGRIHRGIIPSTVSFKIREYTRGELVRESTVEKKWHEQTMDFPIFLKDTGFVTVSILGDRSFQELSIHVSPLSFSVWEDSNGVWIWNPHRPKIQSEGYIEWQGAEVHEFLLNQDGLAFLERKNKAKHYRMYLEQDKQVGFFQSSISGKASTKKPAWLRREGLVLSDTSSIVISGVVPGAGHDSIQLILNHESGRSWKKSAPTDFSGWFQVTWSAPHLLPKGKYQLEIEVNGQPRVIEPSGFSTLNLMESKSEFEIATEKFSYDTLEQKVSWEGKIQGRWPELALGQEITLEWWGVDLPLYHEAYSTNTPNAYLESRLLHKQKVTVGVGGVLVNEWVLPPSLKGNLWIHVKLYRDGKSISDTEAGIAILKENHLLIGTSDTLGFVGNPHFIWIVSPHQQTQSGKNKQYQIEVRGPKQAIQENFLINHPWTKLSFVPDTLGWYQVRISRDRNAVWEKNFFISNETINSKKEFLDVSVLEDSTRRKFLQVKNLQEKGVLVYGAPEKWQVHSFSQMNNSLILPYTKPSQTWFLKKEGSTWESVETKLEPQILPKSSEELSVPASLKSGSLFSPAWKFKAAPDKPLRIEVWFEKTSNYSLMSASQWSALSFDWNFSLAHPFLTQWYLAINSDNSWPISNIHEHLLEKDQLFFDENLSDRISLDSYASFLVNSDTSEGIYFSTPKEPGQYRMVVVIHSAAGPKFSSHPIEINESERPEISGLHWIRENDQPILDGKPPKNTMALNFEKADSLRFNNVKVHVSNTKNKPFQDFFWIKSDSVTGNLDTLYTYTQYPVVSYHGRALKILELGKREQRYFKFTHGAKEKFYRKIRISPSPLYILESILDQYCLEEPKSNLTLLWKWLKVVKKSKEKGAFQADVESEALEILTFLEELQADEGGWGWYLLNSYDSGVTLWMLYLLQENPIHPSYVQVQKQREELLDKVKLRLKLLFQKESSLSLRALFTKILGEKPPNELQTSLVTGGENVALLAALAKSLGLKLSMNASNSWERGIIKLGQESFWSGDGSSLFFLSPYVSGYFITKNFYSSHKNHEIWKGYQNFLLRSMQKGSGLSFLEWLAIYETQKLFQAKISHQGISKIFLDSQFVQAVNWELDPRQGLVYTFPEKWQSLLLGHEKEGNLYYAIEHLPLEEDILMSSQRNIQVNWFPLIPKWVGPKLVYSQKNQTDQFKEGDRVRVQIQWEAPEEKGVLRIHLPIPPGFQKLNWYPLELEKGSEEPAPKILSESEIEGELKISLALEGVRKGSIDLIGVLTQAGKFQIPPVRIYLEHPRRILAKGQLTWITVDE